MRAAERTVQSEETKQQTDISIRNRAAKTEEEEKIRTTDLKNRGSEIVKES